MYPSSMSISVRTASPADREVCIRLLIAQLLEHDLSADPAGIGGAVDLAFTLHSPAWLLLAELDGVAVGIILANQIVSVEKCGYTLVGRGALRCPRGAPPTCRQRLPRLHRRRMAAPGRALG
jgi:hypothetical protein